MPPETYADWSLPPSAGINLSLYHSNAYVDCSAPCHVPAGAPTQLPGWQDTLRPCAPTIGSHLD
jgi:hypothetical protein